MSGWSTLYSWNDFKHESILITLLILHSIKSRSSSTIWYSFSFIEAIQGVVKGDRTWQVAFGSGFKVRRSFLFREHRSAARRPAVSSGCSRFSRHSPRSPSLTSVASLLAFKLHSATAPFGGRSRISSGSMVLGNTLLDRRRGPWTQ